ALLDLRRDGRVLEKKDVGLRVAGAEDRHEVAARAVAAGLDLPGERVDLPDRALEVLLADLVVGRGHGSGKLRRLHGAAFPVHQALRVARRTWRSRRAL